jgi:purine-binding chemotaxis protein CheW
MNEVAGHELVEVLVFEVGGRRYGLRAADVREILRAVTVVPLPRAPAIVEGVINLRGAVVPVLDLRSRFGLPAKAAEPADHLIVARVGAQVVALRVDRALDLVRLGPGDIEETRGLAPGMEYVSWVAKLPEDLLLIHDLRTFLSWAESANLEASLAASQPARKEGG